MTLSSKIISGPIILSQQRAVGYLYKALLLLILFVAAQEVQGRNVQGYIVIDQVDTVYGYIRLPGYNLYTGAIIINGINLEPFHYIVRFKDIDKRTFKTYEPFDGVSAFGILDDTTYYRFERFDIETRSIFPHERRRQRFLNLVFKGELSIYRDIIRTTGYSSTNALNTNNSNVYYDYYLYSDTRGLQKVSPTADFKTLVELLRYYKVDEKFLEGLLPDPKYRDIRDILFEYEVWKAREERSRNNV